MTSSSFLRYSVLVLCGCFLTHLVVVQAGETKPDSRAKSKATTAPDYTTQIAPIFNKHCVACHNSEDRDGELSLESYAELQKGGEHGPALLAGTSASSRMIRMITGTAKPTMPPEDEGSLSEKEIAILKAWIDAGAKGPVGAEPSRTTLLTPHVKPIHTLEKSITALASSSSVPNSKQSDILAIGRYQQVELKDAQSGKRIHLLEGHAGKIHSLEFHANGSQLLVASGIVGLTGEATLWDVSTGKQIKKFQGHRDSIYHATLSPNGQWLATGGYDRKILIWDVQQGTIVREITSHNGAIYDLAFNRDGTVLASASADETVKLWEVRSGRRLDTLGQPEGEQYSVAFSPDDRFVVAGGADNRIRVWRFLSKKKPRINPLVISRFAHEGSILNVRFHPNGKHLVSTAEDKAVKLWETRQFTQIHDYPLQPDHPVALAFDQSSNSFQIGRLNGSLERYRIVKSQNAEKTTPKGNRIENVMASEQNIQQVKESEPNNQPKSAAALKVPFTVSGTIATEQKQESPDVDLFRFSAKAGDQLVVEVNAARKKSKLDSKVEVLTSQGEPILRANLQAVRNSWFTFRGKDSNTSDDFRVHNWEEMELNEYLYANGEVVKLWLYPRGPDSGFKVYPGSGNRYTWFDTTANSHALGEPCYIVEHYEPLEPIIPNGLPVFPVFFENDDDSLRRWGKDSRLMFTAPFDGEYLVRLSDVRNFSGKDYHYELTVRPRKPDFTVSLGGANPTIPLGSGKEFSVTATRLDHYDGPIEVHLNHIPKGFHVSTPIVIEAGQNKALGTIHADPSAKEPSEVDCKNISVEAIAQIWGKEVRKSVNNLGRLKVAKTPTVLIKLFAATANSPKNQQMVYDFSKPLELTIQPGETITAKLKAERKSHKGVITFGKDDAGRNLPHGLYVDNIGLNGLMLLANEKERLFFITAAKWVPETTRMFHLKSNVDGGVVSQSVIIHVRKNKEPQEAN